MDVRVSTHYHITNICRNNQVSLKFNTLPVRP